MASRCDRSEASCRSTSSVARSEAVLELVRRLAQHPDFGKRDPVRPRAVRERAPVAEDDRRRSPASTSASSSRSFCSPMPLGGACPEQRINHQGRRGKEPESPVPSRAGGEGRNSDLVSLPEASVVVVGTDRWQAPTHDLLGHRSPSACSSSGASSVTYATTVRDFLVDEGRGRSKSHGGHITGPHPRGSASVERRRRTEAAEHIRGGGGGGVEDAVGVGARAFGKALSRGDDRKSGSSMGFVSPGGSQVGTGASATTSCCGVDRRHGHGRRLMAS